MRILKVDSLPRCLFILSLTLVSPIASQAQEATDTIAKETELNEVVVEAPRVVQKADRDVYFPSVSARERSANGLQLLQNLRIPTVSVNQVFGSVSALGSAVQVRINGRVVSTTEVKQLNPENIKRIEWIANPGMKYNGASSVINIIAANPTQGGSLMTQATPALNSPWMQGFASLKLNSGRSQWSFSADGQLNNHTKQHRDYYEKFLFPDGSEQLRTETPVKGSGVENYTDFNLAYSYMKPDTTVFHIAINGDKLWGRGDDYIGRMTLSDSQRDLAVTDNTMSKGFTPGISAYLEQHLGHGQTIAFDASASHYTGRATHYYSEEYADNPTTLSAVSTDIRDRNTSFGFSGYYEKQGRQSNITAGMSYSGSLNRSTYKTQNDAVFHQSWNRVYFFGEYRHTISKVTLTGGLGAEYDSHHMRETDLGNSSWAFRPKVSISYRYGNASQWYLSFYTWQASPTLAETNPVAQQIDNIRWLKGDPNLHSYLTYRIDAQYSYSNNRLSLTAGVNAQTSPDAIAPDYGWDDGKLISTYENSKGRRYLSPYISPSFSVVPGWLDINGTLRWSITQTEGQSYRLTRRNWSGDITAALYHWNFQLVLQYSHKATTLIGEREVWPEKTSLAALAYDWKHWQFMFGVLCPFNRYDIGERLLNQYYSNDKHIRIEMAPMPILQISYNLQWGRQKQDVYKRVQSNSSVESSKAGSR